MSPVTDMMNVSDSSKRTFETAKVIEITRNTINFGSSVYQFRNLTGVTVSSIPKQKFLLNLSLMLVLAGFILFIVEAVGLGCFLLLFAALLLFTYFNQSQQHGLRFFLNSGQEIFFLNSNKSFLMEVVEALSKFIEADRDLAIIIDQSTSTITYY